jgi:hypothetical protein
MPEGKDGLEILDFIPENTLEYYRTKRSETGKKRDYVFDYGFSRTCDHAHLEIVARGGIVYRCRDCNYVFHITSAHQQPLHNEAIQAAFTLFVFAKEFGSDALGEVLRTPIGQSDGTAHKPALPEGMSFLDVVQMLDTVDVKADDRGAQQLYAMLDKVWTDAASRARREKEIEGIDPERRPQLGYGQTGKSEEEIRKWHIPGSDVSSLQDGGQGESIPNGSTPQS